MKFTRSEIISMENTLRKLQGMSDALLSRESTDAVNVRHLVALLAEFRACSTLMGGVGEVNSKNRIAAAYRLVEMITYNDTPFANGFDKAALT
jgi:hypothetical protein